MKDAEYREGEFYLGGDRVDPRDMLEAVRMVLADEGYIVTDLGGSRYRAEHPDHGVMTVMHEGDPEAHANLTLVELVDYAQRLMSGDQLLNRPDMEGSMSNEIVGTIDLDPNVQAGISRDGLRMAFTEQGLAHFLALWLEANEGGEEGEAAQRAEEMAAGIFMAAYLELREA